MQQYELSILYGMLSCRPHPLPHDDEHQDEQRAQSEKQAAAPQPEHDAGGEVRGHVEEAHPDDSCHHHLRAELNAGGQAAGCRGAGAGKSEEILAVNPMSVQPCNCQGKCWTCQMLLGPGI